MTSAQEKCTARTEAGSPGFLGQLPPDKPPRGSGWQLCPFHSLIQGEWDPTDDQCHWEEPDLGKRAENADFC